MSDFVQHQERTETITDWDILIKLPELINLDAMSDYQRSAIVIANKLVATMHDVASTLYSYKKLLQTAQENAWPVDDIKIIQEQLSAVEQIRVSTQERLASLQNERKAILSPLIRAGYAVYDAQQREQDRLRLEEWRKNRYNN